MTTGVNLPLPIFTLWGGVLNITKISSLQKVVSYLIHSIMFSPALVII